MKEKLSLASNICIGCPTTWGSHDRYFLNFQTLVINDMLFFFFFKFFRITKSSNLTKFSGRGVFWSSNWSSYVQYILDT